MEANNKVNNAISLDSILEQVCREGKVCTNFIKGYTDEIGRDLESRGYIDVHGKDSNDEWVSPTSEGRMFYNSGEFSYENKRNEDIESDRALSNKSLEVGIDTNQKAVKLAKDANRIAIAALVLSLIAVLLGILK